MAQRQSTSVKMTFLPDNNVNKYSDGDEIEEYLLELFKNGLRETKRRSILADNPSWPVRYHLAYERKNLLGWYDFDDGSRVLEVGAGCGSITESLLEKPGINLVANELSPRRSEVNACRNKSMNNLEIVVGNIYDYKPTKLFDYIVCVGVFEYAGSFVDTANPYHDFLDKLRSLLKPEGKLLLAIENQLGFKYLSGAREDHTGNFYDGLNDYPQKKGVRTFTKRDLEKQLKETGFGQTYFYYPFPDYKLPTIIYSDDYYPGQDDVYFPRAVLPTPAPDRDRQHILSEQGLISVIEKSGLFREFSNSFLVEAKANG